MKTVILAFLLALTFSFGFAQKQKPFQIDSLPKQGILLDNGWKWHAGDNPNFAKVDFDDSKWESIDPTKDIMDLPQLRNTKVSWLRLTFELDTNLTKKGLALLVWQNGATEMYIDNEKFQQFGDFLENGKTIKATQPWGKETFLPIFSKNKKHTISIRFGFESQIKYIKWFGWTNHALRVFICQENDSNYIKNELLISKFLDIFKIGVFMILTILHLTLYFNYRKQRGNLLMGIYALFAGFGFVAAYCNKSIFELNSVFASTWITAILNITSIIVVIELGYYLFSIKKGVSYIFLIGLSFLSIPILYYFYHTGWLVIVLLMFFVCIEVIRLGVITKKDISRSQRVIIYGGIVSLIFYVVAISISGNTDFDFLKHLSYNISYLSLPISFSLFLSFEFAVANKSLEKQLQKVETLSNEKQQILATQNETLERQVETRTTELKASQTQLIQKEKLASLGELTAGIAHEIQNPLNFVNNFSEMSVELAQELKDEIKKPEKDWELIEDLAEDLSQNQAKINHHGKRASSIVSGMLEHSRTSTGERAMTDINKLADEYLRLSYHGMRAKNANGSTTQFNADYELIADENLPLINVVPQDIGRVLLNLINNAFYAVSQRNNVETGHALSLTTKYQPIVKIFTQQHDNQIVIKVKDNGTGMSDDVKAKIFQPFFTTKPTGEGTGLGLSLSYDIITKGHGGTIEVESVLGEGTMFVVKLPLF